MKVVEKDLFVAEYKCLVNNFQTWRIISPNKNCVMVSPFVLHINQHTYILTKSPKHWIFSAYYVLHRPIQFVLIVFANAESVVWFVKCLCHCFGNFLKETKIWSKTPKMLENDAWKCTFQNSIKVYVWLNALQNLYRLSFQTHWLQPYLKV